MLVQSRIFLKSELPKVTMENISGHTLLNHHQRASSLSRLIHTHQLTNL